MKSFKLENDFLEIFATKDMADNGGTAIAFDKGKNTELIKQVNDTIKKLQENGKYEELLKKYHLKQTCRTNLQIEREFFFGGFSFFV